MAPDEHIVLNGMRQHFDQLFNFPPDEWEGFLPCLRVKEVAAKHCLQVAGEKSTHHYFIADGLVRFYYITPEGKELNKGFYKNNHIVGSLSAAILDEPCRFAIETLEPSVLVEIDLGLMRTLAPKMPVLQRLHLHSCEMMLIRNERREAELLTMTARQRFLQFVRNFPDLLERIPQYHIASYLGITPVALSRYKKQWLNSH
ncbi:Crp/Fnr family transcriptional regulator [Spongiibacter sp. KMU-166]|uniref:Crp/Fnr family transcriptional regulator n=1 Tax=Spongiibacter thalassae TaxID=2721624 RepID=A0ABX1G9P9_9GAMM|nr:Crp/Fnr family transcriptional regulator [Spongiibacter thalassae]NKI15884.1 Crp/Fnr family transcriptional regulator [Spongiibacter thalassae]